jgi:DNA polymerase-3 subunit alpha
MSALALTEHGNVSSHVRLEKAANKAGIKPIFGVELYTGAVDEEARSKYKWHLTVLAENAEGYRNLLRLVSRGWAEGMYYEPTVSGEMLAEHSEGLIVLSGCSGSKLVCDLLGGKGVEEHDADFRAALKTAERFQALLGDRYYLEAQAFPELDRTKNTNAALVAISEKLGISLVATGDVHYPRPDDSDMQVILHAAHRGSKTFEDQARSWGYDIKLTPPLSDKAIVDRLVATGMSRRVAEGAVAASATIGDRCNVTLPKAERLRYPCPDGYDSVALFRRWIVAGWKYRGIDKHPRKAEYKERLNYEMRIIEAKDFVDYFLLLSDIVRWAKDEGIPVGPARGSAAASLVCYLLRITEVNPMDFPTLMFERFIDITRADPPDIDLDFADDQRDRVRLRLAEKYGADRVGNIGNFVKYRGKNSLDDVGRVYRIPKWAVELVKGLVIERSSGDSRLESSLADTVEMFPAADEVMEAYPDLKQAYRLEGDMRGMSIHAAGLVVGASPLTDVCAVYTKVRGKDKERISVLSIDKYDAEYLDILKIDALGLSTMGMIDIALGFTGLTLPDLYAIPLDDPETLDVFRRGDVIGIFQFEGRATRLVNKDIVPDNFMELADVNALSRPGPLFSGVTAAYTRVKKGLEEPEFLHEVVSEATKSTKGQIVYQEQILRIVKEIGGFPVTKVSDIRRIISKKLGEGQFHLMFNEFVDGARERYGISPELAKTIWGKMVTSAQYSFVTAHSVSYCMLAWWCAYLKVHYPEAFYTASLRKAGTEEAVFKLIRDAQVHGITISPPDLVRSGITWEMRDGEILAGFTQVKGIGDKMAEEILRDREANGIFKGWADLLRVKGIGPAKLLTIREFAESDDPFGLQRVARMLDAVRAAGLPLPAATHGSDALSESDSVKRVVWWGVVARIEYKDIIEDERAKTGDDVEEIKARIRSPHKAKSATLHCYDDGFEEVYLRINRWHYGKFRKQLSLIRPGEDIVVAVGEKKSAFGVSLQLKRLYVIDPEV